MAEEFPEKWKAYLAMIQKKNPKVPEARIRAALWATDGSAGMAKTMLASPWRCARCEGEGADVAPAHKGWYLVMNAWICQACADEGWVPGPLSKGWVIKDETAETPVGFRRTSDVADVIKEAEAELAAVESMKKEGKAESKKLERRKAEGKKADGKKAVPEVASVTFSAKKEDESFDVTVTKLSGESVTFQCQPRDTVSSLKWNIEEEWKVKRLRQVLTLCEDILDNEEVLWTYSEELLHNTITLLIAPEKKEKEEDEGEWSSSATGTLEVTVKGYGKRDPRWLVWDGDRERWVPMSKESRSCAHWHKNPRAIHTGLDAEDKKRYRKNNYVFDIDVEDLDGECPESMDHPDSIDLNIGDVLFFAKADDTSWLYEQQFESEIEDPDVLESMDDDEFLSYAYVGGAKKHQFPDSTGTSWVGERPNDWLVEGEAVCFQAVGKGSTTLSWTLKHRLIDGEGEEEEEEEDD